MNYYKRIDKSSCNGIKAMEEHYAQLKAKKGVIVSKDDNREFILVPTELLGEFIVTHVSREDFKIAGYDGDNVTNEAMRELAEALEDEITADGGMYWLTIEDKAKELGLLEDDED